MLIAPGAIAFLLTRKFSTMLVLSIAIAVTGSFAGVYLSFFIDSAPAPTIVLVLAIGFVLAFIWTLPARLAVDDRNDLASSDQPASRSRRPKLLLSIYAATWIATLIDGIFSHRSRL
jgi:uncharacterized membrane protein YfcA